MHISSQGVRGPQGGWTALRPPTSDYGEWGGALALPSPGLCLLLPPWVQQTICLCGGCRDGDCVLVPLRGEALCLPLPGELFRAQPGVGAAIWLEKEPGGLAASLWPSLWAAGPTALPPASSPWGGASAQPGSPLRLQGAWIYWGPRSGHHTLHSLAQGQGA